ncbi:MAG: CocE/NonD family hydrolase [Candidatus Latescibacteria bacterium]|nr:CocE/NonD family hydrolase [Candidatus Latescibacterota bacterium]
MTSNHNDAQAFSGALGILTERDIMVPMRDGTRLACTIFRPDAEGVYPGLLLRTPYRKPEDGHERYVRAGYVVVTQDSRGRYASEGKWVPFTVENTGDAEDGYDSVEWLASQPWCNGRVGTIGASYNAWMQWMLAKLKPPHLQAMCAYTIPREVTAVDWPGGFRPGRRIKWWLTSMAPDLRRRAGWPPPHTPEEARTMWDEGIEGEGHWIGLMPWVDVCRHLPPGLSSYALDWLQNPSRRAWKLDEVHSQVEVPNLDFSGWYDHCNDSLHHLGLMQANGGSARAREQTKLVVGPWNHPGLGQRRCGDIDFGPQAQVDLTDLIIDWFDHWLKDVDNDVETDPPVRYFSMGTGRWCSASTWPPTEATERAWYLDSDGRATSGVDGRLQTEPPTTTAQDDYIYDPVNPVPTLWGKEWFTSPADRRKLEHRQDILVYRSLSLNQSVDVAGMPRAVIYISTDAADTDLFVRLIDEHPDDHCAEGIRPGPALEICYGMVRLRYRNGLDTDELLPPGQVTEVTVELGPTACQFRVGHRIRVEVTSSDFPNHDRNHNTGGNDLLETTLVAAATRIHHGADQLSRILLPVMSG